MWYNIKYVNLIMGIDGIVKDMKIIGINFNYYYYICVSKFVNILSVRFRRNNKRRVVNAV